MPRRIFTSFHYQPDSWRVSIVRNIGSIEGNKLATDNDWETVTSGGNTSIKKWINKQMQGRSCVVVFVGSATAGRKWINYEIKKGWDDGKGVLGIHIHNLKDMQGNQSQKGNNPFDGFELENTEIQLSSVVKCYNPPYSNSKKVYEYIRENIVDWIEEAIKIRQRYL